MTTVSGILRDAKGMALPGVAVTLRYVPQVIGYSGGAVAQNNLTYITSDAGLLTMGGLVAGPYDLSIAMPIGTSASVTAAVTARIVVNGETAQTLEDALQTTIGEITPTILSQAIAAADAAAASAAAAALFDPDNFQPIDATLTSIAALGTAPDKIAYTTGVDTWAEAGITAAGRALLDDANAAAQRATLGLVIGTDVQAHLGFTPVEQGGGTDMGPNKVRLGWRTDATGIQAQVDTWPIGVLAMRADLLGVGQTWQAVSRTAGTNYQNTTGRPIVVVGHSAFVGGDLVLSVGAVSPPTLVVSISGTNLSLVKCVQAIIPAAWYYRFSGDYTAFMELR